MHVAGDLNHWSLLLQGVAVVMAKGLKTLYERELRYEVGNLGLGSEERRGLWQLLSASRHMPPDEFHEQDHAQVWLWSDLHLGHAMTISVFGRPYKTPDEMDDALFGAWRRVVEPDDTVVILGDIAMGAALLRRRPKGLLRAARQELLDPSKAWWGGRRGRLADWPPYSISVSLGVVPRWYSRVVEVPVRIEVAAGFVAPGASEPPRLQPSWPPGGSRPAHG